MIILFLEKNSEKSMEAEILQMNFVSNGLLKLVEEYTR
jgi:hypothetical protein